MNIGILGGGQLGRMFLQVVANYPVRTKVLDPASDAPARLLCDEFVVGDFADEAVVLEFAKDCDVITIEIEHVSVSALEKLEAMGKKVVPSAHTLKIIQDKGLQKEFYRTHGFATAPFYCVDGAKEVDNTRLALPFVQKTRTGGYDGKGVQCLHTQSDWERLWDEPSVIEAMGDIEKELAVMVAVDGQGNAQSFPTVEMVFDPVFNLVDVVQMPAQISAEIEEKAQKLARDVVQAFASAGIFAVELFLLKNGDLWVNEIAPRVHNSGHLSIESCITSQFEQMLRVVLGLALGDCAARCHSAMLNLVGSSDGLAYLPYLDDLTAISGAYVHWYGKKDVRVGRKMGHVTVIADNFADLQEKISRVKPFLVVEGK